MPQRLPESVCSGIVSHQTPTYDADLPSPEGLLMEETDPVADWIRRWSAGDQVAAGQLFDRYAARLTQIAGQHLSRKLAGREDGEDVVQSVFRTFFRRSTEGHFQIDSSAQLWRLLVKITLQKV